LLFGIANKPGVAPKNKNAESIAQFDALDPY
jgi:hypothetical protein